MVSTLRAELVSNEVQSTSEPGRLLGQWFREGRITKDSLVIMDLDDTTITTPEGQWLGRSDMFYDLLEQQVRLYPEKKKDQIANAIDPLLTAVYERVPVITTDATLPQVIEQMRGQGVKVIAMTARGKQIRDITLQQLDWVGIKFSDLGEPRWVKLDEIRTFRIEKNGVVFVSHGNRKGEVLTQMMKEGKLGNFKNIIFVDDRRKHLVDVKKSLETFQNKIQNKIQYNPVLCTYLDKVTPYNSAQAHRQLIEFLSERKNEKEIKQLIKNDLYTQSIISNCSKTLKDATLCNQLKN